MKLFTFFLFIATLQLSAKSYSQKINLSGSDITLKQAFRQIEKQTGYSFFVNHKLLREEKPVSFSLRDATIGEAMQTLLKGKPLSYAIIDRTVILKEKEDTPPKEDPDIILPSQPIEGMVRDSATGDPLAGVTIRVKGTTTGAVTDGSGRFSLEAEDDAVLDVSFVGYSPQEVPVNGRSSIDVLLSSSATGLDQLVVVGYGVQKKINLTGAVSSIESKDIEKRITNNTVEALRGLAPNLNIASGNTAGMTDGTMDIDIRGAGSLGAAEPYILIDGIRASQSEFSSLNPKNIEDISVLKDAASAAIYGAQAAFGVILVTTKSGRKNEDIRINLSSDFSWSELLNVPSSISTVDYIKVVNQSGQDYSGQNFIPEENIAKVIAFESGDLEYGTEADPNNPNHWLGILGGTSIDWYSGFSSTDWWRELYKNVSFKETHNVSVSGGTEKLRYNIAGGFIKDYGQLKYGGKNEKFSRVNFSSNVGADITNWLNISNITRFYQKDNIFPATLEGASRGRLFHDVMRWSPLTPLKTPPVLDDDGNVLVPEQLATLAGFNENNGFDEYREQNLVSTFRLNIRINKDIDIKADYAFKKNWYNETLNWKKWTFFGPDAKPSITYQANNNAISKNWKSLNYHSMNIYGNLRKTLGEKHNLEGLLGYQMEENEQENLNILRNDVVADYLNSLNISVGDINGPTNPITSWGTQGIFGRLSYNYEEKYLFEFNGRYDGSSRFPKGHRFGFFPSFSVGYNIFKEDFWEPLQDIINVLKIRASYGRLGNQDVASNLFLSSVPVHQQLPWVIGGVRPTYTTMPSIISPSITWEVAITKNLGFDLSFLRNRLSTSFDIYSRDTKDMFGPSEALPAVLGANAPQTNSASLRTKGWEFEIEWSDLVQEFGYNLKFMVSNNLTKIIKYRNPSKVLSDWYEGQTMGEIWGFKADDLFQSEDEVSKYLSSVDLSYFGTSWQPGDVKYLDLNGDGKVDIGDNTVGDPGDQIVIGNNRPRYELSLAGSVSWKGIDLYMLWQGVGKRDLMLDDYATLFWGWNGQGHSHLTKESMDHWRKDNPNGYLPIPLLSEGRDGFSKDRFPSTRYLLNAAYVRLRSLSLGYTFDNSFLDKLKITDLRVYISAQNLVTITSLWSSLDPELIFTGERGRTGDGRAYPLPRTFSVGFNVNF